MNIENLQVLIDRRRKLQNNLEYWNELVGDIDGVKEVTFRYPYRHVTLSEKQAILECSGAIGDELILKSVKRIFILELKGKISEITGELVRIDKIIQDAEAALITVEDPDITEKAS